MTMSIPYDPSLELANIVPEKTLKTMLEISTAQASVNATQEALNRAILTVPSLEMTMSEMTNMKIDVTPVAESLKKAQTNVQTGAKELITARLTAWPKINELKKTLTGMSEAIESPVDYNKTAIKKMPLSADSLTMDAQYFSHDSERQGASNSLMAISSFVSAATSFLGDKMSAEATSSAKEQVSKQIEHHDIEGTLIITAGCTHKQAAVLAPFILDVDKAIRVWNYLFPDEMIKTNSLQSMQEIAEKQQTKDAKKFTILSGASYGSSFVGMVHVLRSSETKSSQKMTSAAASLRGTMQVGSWFESMKGGFGINTSFANDAKKLLSSQDITSHISLISMGSIPSITSTEVQIGVEKFANFDAAKMMEQLAAYCKPQPMQPNQR